MQGSKGEISAMRKTMIRHLSNGRLDKIVENMEDAEYVKYCLAIFEYVMPRLNRIDVKGDVEVHLPIKELIKK